jgi:succinate dehydrogenase / fumarate reductase cytochrome b subunit
LLHSPIGQIALYGLVAALGFHLLAGLRHLVLDTGLWFKKPSANLSAWIAVSGLAIAPAALFVTLLLLQD